MDCRT